jgi:hypothetical protein
MMIALTFSIGGLIRSRLIKMFLSIISVFVAIAGTWWVHINFSPSQIEVFLGILSTFPSRMNNS